VANVPDTIVLKRDRDLEGRRNEIWVRRSLFGLLCVVPLLALLNVFGQRPAGSEAAAGAAQLSVYAPDRVRGGLLYEARFHVTAKQDIRKAILVLGSGWLEGMTVNTIEPAPTAETSADGSLSLDLGRISAGDSYLLFVQFQVNPTNVGHRDRLVELYDGPQKLLTMNRAVTIFP
jgi:hypothetical protein